MKKKVIIWGGIAIVAGIATYFIVKRFRKPQTSDVPAVTPGAEVVPPAGGGGGNEGDGGGSSAPTELDSKAKVLAFQQWVINTKKDKTMLGRGGASGYGDDGIWKAGGKTDAAWTKYGAEYKGSGGSGGSTTDASLEKAINLIVAKGSNASGKANRTYLLKTNPDWVKKWAWNLDNDRSAFGWGSYIWRTKTGQDLLDYNAIDQMVKTKSDATPVHETSYSSSDNTEISKLGTKIGPVKNVKFDGTVLWFYIPSYSTVYKWIKAKDVKKA